MHSHPYVKAWSCRSQCCSRAALSHLLSPVTGPSAWGFTCVKHSTGVTEKTPSAPSNVSFLHPLITVLTASPFESLWFSHGVDSEHTSDMNCCRVNNVSAQESCSEWVISACLRHYDAVPYLTMLLFVRALQQSGRQERGGERVKNERSEKMPREISGQEEIRRQRDKESEWYREPKIEERILIGTDVIEKASLQYIRSVSANSKEGAPAPIAGQPHTVNQ